ncbi:MAG TPA: hypothetical protein V6C82_08320, partial [Chroococcales cyanobacterium]
MGKKLCISLFAFALWGNLVSPASADELARLYGAALARFPSLRGFESSERALSGEVKALQGDRLLNLSGEAGISQYRPNGDRGVLLTLSDDLDLFRKGKPSEEKIYSEIRLNSLEAALERRDLFEKLG